MLLALLMEGAARDADRPALVTDARTVTYGELVADASPVASGLRALGAPAVGCALRDPIDIATFLAAASGAGIEGCVYPRDWDAEALTALAERLGHTTVISADGLTLDAVRAKGDPDAAPVAAGDDGTVLILTTGTTGTPKGVRHAWARLVGPHADRRRGPGAGEGQRWLLAYNLNQFAGYQVLIHGLVAGATLVVPASAHAQDAIAAMYQHRVTHVSATPTFWRMLVGALRTHPRELSLEQITLGGEATPATLMESLHELFPDTRVSHVYAGTEFGSAISVHDGQSGLPESVLNRPDDADVRFRVVDGELHVLSRHAMVGYQDATPGAADWIATGDLVEQRGGRLHFVGRTVEIINVGGAKVHPLPLEERIGDVAGVAEVAIYGRPNAITGQIVAADVALEAGAVEDDVRAAIQAACADLPAPSRPRRITFVDQLQTRGSKKLRTAREVGT